MINWADIAPTIADFAGLNLDAAAFQGRSFRSVLNRENPSGWDEVYASHTFHEVTMYQPMRVVRGRRWKLIWNIAHEQKQPMSRDLRESSTWQSWVRRGIERMGKRSMEAFFHRPEFELYDLENDPDEVVNLAGQPEQAARLSELTGKLKAFQERTKDPWIIVWEDHPGVRVVEKH